MAFFLAGPFFFVGGGEASSSSALSLYAADGLNDSAISATVGSSRAEGPQWRPRSQMTNGMTFRWPSASLPGRSGRSQLQEALLKINSKRGLGVSAMKQWQ